MPQVAHPATVDHIEFSEAERAWLENSFRKVTVKVGSEEELMAVYEQGIRTCTGGWRSRPPSKS